MSRVAFVVIVIPAALAPINSQPPPPALVGAQFDVVSIKLNKSGRGGGWNTFE